MRIRAGLLLAFAIALPCAAAAPVRSGDYDGLLVAVGPQGRLTVYFESSTGSGQFSCVFFGAGLVTGGKHTVDTWYPADRPGEVIRGVLEDSAVGAKPGVRLTLEEEHGGCANVQRFASEPASFALTEPGGWIAIGVVASARAYFRDDPSGPPRKAFVVAGNPLRIYEERGGWVRAEYVGATGKRTQGWLRQSELFPAVRPARTPDRRGGSF